MSSITVPYSVNAINGHVGTFTRGTYNFTTTIEAITLITQVETTKQTLQHFLEQHPFSVLHTHLSSQLQLSFPIKK